MDTAKLVHQFNRIGAQAEVLETSANNVRLDVRQSGREEIFQLRVGADADLRAVDTQPRDRHLLLMSVNADGRKDKFLCGHDERHWFVAGVPDSRGVSNVATAKEALKPKPVRDAENRVGLRRRDRQRRRNAAFIRQGEWFFVPEPSFDVGSAFIWKNEPISRGFGSKPHMCEELCRFGGESVFITRGYPNGLTTQQYRKLIAAQPAKRHLPWQTQVRNPDVYVRGRVRHPDHATVRLQGWHRVLMNTEHEAPASRVVAFID